MDIAEFLAARLDEDEQVAQSAAAEYPAPWQDDMKMAFTAHVARHDPPRVLAEVAGKRAILGLHRPRVPHGYSHSLGEMIAAGGATCSVCGDQGVDITTVYYPCDTLRALASVHAGHPDFDPAWSLTVDAP